MQVNRTSDFSKIDHFLGPVQTPLTQIQLPPTQPVTKKKKKTLYPSNSQKFSSLRKPSSKGNSRKKRFQGKYLNHVRISNQFEEEKLESSIVQPETDVESFLDGLSKKGDLKILKKLRREVQQEAEKAGFGMHNTLFSSKGLHQRKSRSRKKREKSRKSKSPQKPVKVEKKEPVKPKVKPKKPEVKEKVDPVPQTDKKSENPEEKELKIESKVTKKSLASLDSLESKKPEKSEHSGGSGKQLQPIKVEEEAKDPSLKKWTSSVKLYRPQVLQKFPGGVNTQSLPQIIPAPKKSPRVHPKIRNIVSNQAPPKKKASTRNKTHRVAYMAAYHTTKKINEKLRETNQKEQQKHKKMVARFRKKKKEENLLRKTTELNVSNLSINARGQSALNRSGLGRPEAASPTPQKKGRVRYLEKDRLVAFIGRGNNEALVRRLFEKRRWWKVVSQEQAGGVWGFCNLKGPSRRSATSCGRRRQRASR